MVDHQLDEAAQDIRHHSRPGPQRPPVALGPGSPLPQPLPLPVRPPIDLEPRPLPFPELPVTGGPARDFPVIKPWQGVLV